MIDRSLRQHIEHVAVIGQIPKLSRFSDKEIEEITKDRGDLSQVAPEKLSQIIDGKNIKWIHPSHVFGAATAVSLRTV